MSDAWDNPMGTDGFEWVEYAAADPAVLQDLFTKLGFVATARHKTKKITLYRQGDVNFLVNGEPEGFSASFFQAHGPCACSMAFRVADAAYAHQRALELGAKDATAEDGPLGAGVPAIEGIGGSRLYLVDIYGDRGAVYDDDFEPIPGAPKDGVGGLAYLDHLTHNVGKGEMDVWAGFYEKIFNFKEIRFFDIEGKATGLTSRAMTGPCGKLRIPINEDNDDRGQIAEYLREYNGPGIQHIALGATDIYQTVDALKAQGLEFQDTPDTYYEKIDARLPGHGEPVDALRARRVLVDGDGPSKKLLLQIFTKTVIGPIFFEIIQRKGDDGFGEGNFKALFESIEEDQIQRGVLKESA